MSPATSGGGDKNSKLYACSFVTGASFTIAKEVRSEFGNEFVILFGAEVLFSNKDETLKQLEINCA